MAGRKSIYPSVARNYIRREVSAAQLRHNSLLMGFAGIVSSEVVTGNGGVEQIRDRVRLAVAARASEFLSAEQTRVAQILYELSELGAFSRGRDSVALASRLDFLDLQVLNHVNRNASAYIRHADRVIFLTKINSVSPTDWPIVAVKSMKQLEKDLRLGYVDSKGKLWKPDRYIEVLYGANLFGAYNEGLIEDLFDRGRKTAYVDYPDHAEHNTRFAIGESSRMPSYSQLQFEVFHPGSEALIKDAA